MGTVLSTVASWYGSYLFDDALAAVLILIACVALFVGGNLALARYQASGQRQSRPVRFNRNGDLR